MNLTLKIWRQKNAADKGKLVDYQISDVSPDMSFLEMLDVLNEQLINKGESPVAFDHDCREGICGMCSLYINGEAHGPDRGITTCQLHMRKFKDGDTIYIEPFRANAFPVIRDLVVDRSAFDRIQHAGGFISVNTSGNTIDANAIPINKHDADKAFEAALEAGADDVTEEDGYIEIVGAAEIFKDLHDSLANAGLKIEDAGLRMIPKQEVELDPDQTLAVLRIITALEESDDVQNVYTNLKYTDEDLEKLEED